MNTGKHRKHFIILVWLLYPFVQSYAADELPEVRVIIRSGSQFEICQDYAAELKEHRATITNYCGVAIPLDNPDYRLPRWENIDPAENIQLVRDIYYWFNLNRSVGQELYDRQHSNRSQILPEILELLWPPVEEQVLALIEGGEVELQQSRIDIDFDTVIETVYRMTPVIRTGGNTPPQDQPSQKVEIYQKCDDFNLPGADKRYIYYVPLEDLPSLDYGLWYVSLWEGYDFFYWRGRIYWAIRGGVFEPHTLDFTGVRQVCGILSGPILLEGGE